MTVTTIAPRYTAYDERPEAPRRPRSRRELVERARSEERMRRGRRAFVWKSRVVPIGVPLGALAAFIAWRRTRDRGVAAGSFAGVILGSFTVASLEFARSRRIYRSVHGLDFERSSRWLA